MKPFIGVVHLQTLPGAPLPTDGIEAVVQRARSDAASLRAGGVSAIIVENLGDAPFSVGRVSASTVAMMTRAVLEVQQVAPGIPIGVNVLRNDAVSAMAIAAAADAQFVRVNVFVGAMVTDQGLIQGAARAVLQTRRDLGASGVKIAADVMVKHAVPLGDPRLEDVARDAWHRGRADQLIVSGSGTGHPTSPSEVHRVRQAVPDAEIWIGSGITPDNIGEYVMADGFIVGTYLHEDSDVTAPIDVDRTRRMADAIQAAKS